MSVRPVENFYTFIGHQMEHENQWALQSAMMSFSCAPYCRDCFFASIDRIVVGDSPWRSSYKPVKIWLRKDELAFESQLGIVTNCYPATKKKE